MWLAGLNLTEVDDRVGSAGWSFNMLTSAAIVMIWLDWAWSGMERARLVKSGIYRNDLGLGRFGHGLLGLLGWAGHLALLGSVQVDWPKLGSAQLGRAELGLITKGSVGFR